MSTHHRALHLTLALAMTVVITASCRRGRSPEPSDAAAASAASSSMSAAPLSDRDECTASIEAILRTPSLPGAPEFDRARVHVLGRARGEPMVFVREPARSRTDDLPEALRQSSRLLETGPAGARVTQVLKRHAREPASLRTLLLREGYAYAPEPLDALALIANARLPDLFDEPELWMMRRTQVHRLVRSPMRGVKCSLPTCPSGLVEYRYAEGPYQGQPVDLLFGDRLGLSPEALAGPLHRDLRSLAMELGFSKASIVHRTEAALIAWLQVGDVRVRARLDTQGAWVRAGCLETTDSDREALSSWRSANHARLRSLPRIEGAIDKGVNEALRFDRPEGVKHAELDGKLRPVWWDAYRHRQAYFSYDDVSYPVYDAAGRPWPPQVCVDLVLDTYERASGTWFTARGEEPQRVKGRLDFDAHGIVNRRGVLAFETWASEHPELFETRRFAPTERIQFGERTKFFDFLQQHAELFRASDVVAIQGRKRDGLIHQHAIFVEATDPITGFPYGLFDQMKRPRRRTWEGIMAEAPARSLLYRVRPTDRVFDAIAGPGEGEGTTTGRMAAGASD